MKKKVGTQVDGRETQKGRIQVYIKNRYIGGGEEGEGDEGRQR